jgi:hypothetical protein
VGNEADLTAPSRFCVIIAVGFLMHNALRMHKLSTLTKGVNRGRCVMVKDIFEALQNTPIPTILVVAGIAFLLLSVAGQLAGRIAVPPERQRHATIIGGLLLVVGVALNIGPQLWTSPKPLPPDTKPLSPSTALLESS